MRLIQDEQNLKDKIAHLKTGDPFLDPDHANDNAAVDTDIREQMVHETITAQLISLEKKITNIQATYRKLEDGSYGSCESCGKEIQMERLELVPEARHCIDCERRLRR
ncbi:MAG TPA: TraR/DksA C4-type zinc finger protein [Candidatus Nitrosocosmicus sp.]|nr:TraR/DksA C4-type zinc finger protein [Candidatus Nitrosocosmicus sp.]